MVVVAVIATVVYLNISLTRGIVHLANKPICMPLSVFQVSVARLDQGDIIVNGVIPDTMVIVLLVLIVFAVIRRKVSNGTSQSLNGIESGRSDLDTSALQHGPHMTHSIQYNRAVIGVLLVYILLAGPVHFIKFIHMIKQLAQGRVNTSLEEFLWEQVLQYPFSTKLCLNFVIFLATIGEFRKRLCSCCDRRDRRGSSCELRDNNCQTSDIQASLCSNGSTRQNKDSSCDRTSSICGVGKGANKEVGETNGGKWAGDGDQETTKALLDKS